MSESNHFGIERAFAEMRAGHRVARVGWEIEHDAPSFLVLVPAREITTSYEPMTTHLGAGRKVWVQEHVDAIHRASGGAYIVVNYQFGRSDIWSQDWYVATGTEG